MWLNMLRLINCLPTTKNHSVPNDHSAEAEELWSVLIYVCISHSPKTMLKWTFVAYNPSVPEDLPIYPPTHLLTNLCTYLPTYQPTYPPVCLSIYWSLSILCFLSFDREGFISFSNKFQYILPQRLQGYIIILIFRFSKKNFKPRTFRHSLWYSVSVIQGMASDCQWVGLYFVEEKEVLL